MPIKKVLYISTASNISGATLALLEIVDEMKKHDVVPVVVTAERGVLEKELDKRDIKYIKARYASWLCRKGELDSITGKIKYGIKKMLEKYSEAVITRALKNEKPDIVHINTGMSPVGLKSAHELNIPVIWHIRELPWVYWKRLPYDETYEIRCHREADVLIAISEFVKTQYMEKSANNLIRLYDGVDLSSYSGLRKQRILSSDTICLSLCGGYEEKGHIDAIKAIPRLIDWGITNFKLSFWGAFIPEYKKNLETIIQDLNVEEWISFEGKTDRMPEKWSQTDIALICSKGEAFGRVTVEAMAAGALVIGANVGATPELVADHRGLLYEQGNPDDLADKIQYAISHVSESVDIANHARDYVLDGHFSLKEYTEKLLQIYSDAQNNISQLEISK